MTPPHGYSTAVGAKHRFNASEESLEIFVEEHEFLLQRQDEDTEEDREVEDHSPLRQHFTLLGLGYLSLVCLKLYPGMFNTILSQILESILCRQYHDTSDPSLDPRCKDETVQGELSMLLSMRATFELLPTVVFSIPYGIAADMYGRKPVIILATMGCVLYGILNLVICWYPGIFPLHLFWAVPIVYIVGGGPLVPVMMIYAMASDVVPESRRSGVFIVLSTGLVFGTLLSGPATYYLMPKGEWNAIYISVWFQVLGVIITCFLPETLTTRKEQSDTNTPRGRHSTTSTLRSKSQELLVKLFTSLRQIFSSDTTVTLFVVSLLFIDVGEDIASIITKQYAAKRFQLTWPEAGVITSMKSIAQLVLCLVVLPFAQKLMRQHRVSAIRQDARIARTCLIILLIAYFMAGLADSLVVFITAIVMSAVNFCLNPALRSLLLTMAHNAGAGTVLSAVEALNAMSAVVAGPLMAEGFRLGISWGGKWIGLHWFLAMLILLPGAVIVICIRFDDFERRRSLRVDEDDDL
ncbi:mfs transporter [Fusarium langsethiae]|uniref:Mfs transporter n=1 Tax=Fusarium langsethiae TaxID=179993 RepID=A0A0M9ERV5_FUSLA|nr:mfs transporter [Fusarium langsethiae]